VGMGENAMALDAPSGVVAGHYGVQAASLGGISAHRGVVLLGVAVGVLGAALAHDFRLQGAGVDVAEDCDDLFGFVAVKGLDDEVDVIGEKKVVPV